jgi:hypothetical protein
VRAGGLRISLRSRGVVELSSDGVKEPWVAADQVTALAVLGSDALTRKRADDNTARITHTNRHEVGAMLAQAEAATETMIIRPGAKVPSGRSSAVR